MPSPRRRVERFECEHRVEELHRGAGVELFRERRGAFLIAGLEPRRIERNDAAARSATSCPVAGSSRANVFTTSPARIVPMRAASPCPFCGSARLYVDVVDVSRRADGEQREHARALDLAEHLAERVRVIRRRLHAADRVLVQREIDVGRQRLAGCGLEQDHRQVGIDRPRGPDDVRIQLARDSTRQLPSFMKKRRLKLTLSSRPLPNETRAGVIRALASRTLSAILPGSSAR